MRNQKLETKLAYKSAKCNTLCQCGVITDPPHYIHTQNGVFFVAHKAIIVRTSKISSCLSHIFLILTSVSRDGRKITTTRKHLTISFGAQRNRYKTDKIAFFNFKLIARMSLLNRRFRIRQIVSRVMGELIVYQLPRHPSVVRPSTFSNIFSSETTGPIELKFHMETP